MGGTDCGLFCVGKEGMREVIVVAFRLMRLPVLQNEFESSS